MGKIKIRNLVGEKFGNLLVIKELPFNQEINQQMWECKCVCGEKIICKTYQLIYGQRHNCDKCKLRKYKDLTNIRYDKIIILGLDDEKNRKEKIRVEKREIKNFRRFWICKCDCGKIFSVNESSLRGQNHIKACQSCANKRRVKYNKYDLTNEYGIGFTDKNEEFYFDLEDYDKIKDYYWGKTKHDYMRTYINGKSVFIHKVITNTQYPTIVDHINKQPLDNRKINLRICTQQENTFNGKVPKNNTTGIIGVYFRKDTNKWTAKIMLDRKEKNLGCFVNKEDAIKSRLIAEKEYFGEFAPQRHLFEQYGIEQDDKYFDVACERISNTKKE